MKPFLSLLTPSYEREGFLRALYYALLQQDYSGSWEWIIHDMSIFPSSFFQELKDPRVRYYYSEERVSIGKSRNVLKGLSQGEVLVHCDDDDYYAPHYLSTVVQEMEAYDFFHIYSWFCYDVKTQQSYYWAMDHLDISTAFVLDPFSGTKTREIDYGCRLEEVQEKFTHSARCGYGFTYAYHKHIAPHCHFPDISHQEDLGFYQEVERKGFKIRFLPDETGHVIKMIHDNNVSTVYPQYRVPFFIVDKLFPYFSAFLKTYPTIAYEN